MNTIECECDIYPFLPLACKVPCQLCGKTTIVVPLERLEEALKESEATP